MSMYCWLGRSVFRDNTFRPYVPRSAHHLFLVTTLAQHTLGRLHPGVVNDGKVKVWDFDSVYCGRINLWWLGMPRARSHHRNACNDDAESTGKNPGFTMRHSSLSVIRFGTPAQAKPRAALIISSLLPAQKPNADLTRLNTLVLSSVPLNGLAPAPAASNFTSPPPCVSLASRTPLS